MLSDIFRAETFYYLSMQLVEYREANEVANIPTTTTG